MLAINDLFNIEEMEGYSLEFQKVSKYDSFRKRAVIENHLRTLMCEEKMSELLKDTYVIEVTKPIGNDVVSFDGLKLTDMYDYQQYQDDLHEIEDDRVMGRISYIIDKIILFDIPSKDKREARRQSRKLIETDRYYHVQFLPNRVSIRVAQEAVAVAIKHKLEDYLELFKPTVKVEKKPSHKDFVWMNKKISGNNEQKMAIENIVNCTSFPAPYICFGPPGTGKTAMIVEAIAQIVKLKRDACILVTTKCNLVCDDIGNRLLEYVSINKIFRFYSTSFDKKPEKIDKKLERISNYRDRQLCKCNKRSCPSFNSQNDPTYEEFYSSRVVIATLVTCGRIFFAGIKSNHFDYIFIDEAASAGEPFTLIPIALLGADKDGVNAQIVLSGDHKQLGEIVKDQFCAKMGMEKSMMERMIETHNDYSRLPKYNPKFITQLILNYRSHPAILQFSNDNFYDSKLIYKCPREIANFACSWDRLRNKDFPLLFHTLRTPSYRVGTSLANEGEVNEIDFYVRHLLKLGINKVKVYQEDIGIISPYRAQRDKIIEKFQSKFKRIEIGTVDAFQGREKKIIIMSTVRSGTKHVGFLKNEKRLNVSLTRSMCLLIIVGNSSTLQKCILWKQFIAYCINNRAIVGDTQRKIIVDKDYERREDIPNGVEEEYD